jgi:D-tagatose-1,6-bisphosphate aldolase subunit GatZ/KbaZ
MVADHFAILKVGPALTFAFREAVFSLSQIEREWLSGRSGISLSNITEIIETAMLQEPVYWKKYYHGSDSELGLARRYSYSDRIRYYWPHHEIQEALQRLIQNLSAQPLPLTLVSQFMPLQYQHIQDGQIKCTPLNLIHDKVIQVCRSYTFACSYP